MHVGLPHLKLIPARGLFANLDPVPEQPGVYLLFLTGGMSLLETTAYFDVDERHPASINGRAHLYTGAADNLRARLKQHLIRDRRASSFRQTLLAVEHARKAISRTLTPACKIVGEASLSEWLRENLTIGIQLAKRPFELESDLIGALVSPFNITLRRSHPYSRVLMHWRNVAFPPWRHPSRMQTISSDSPPARWSNHEQIPESQPRQSTSSRRHRTDRQALRTGGSNRASPS